MKNAQDITAYLNIGYFFIFNQFIFWLISKILNTKMLLMENLFFYDSKNVDLYKMFDAI